MLPSPIPFAPASSSSTGKYLTVEVPVPLIPSNLPVPLMISLVNWAAVGAPGAVPVTAVCALIIIVIILHLKHTSPMQKWSFFTHFTDPAYLYETRQNPFDNNHLGQCRAFEDIGTDIAG